MPRRLIDHRVVVTGSRDFSDSKAIRAFLTELTVRARNYGERIIVIHGGARGADTIAGEIAHEFGFDVEVYPADWRRHGKRAGVIRNVEMLERGATQVVAFWDGKSRGTLHTIRAARDRAMRVTIVRPGDADIVAQVNGASGIGSEAEAS